MCYNMILVVVPVLSWSRRYIGTIIFMQIIPQRIVLLSYFFVLNASSIGRVFTHYEYLILPAVEFFISTALLQLFPGNHDIAFV